jgi:hypothetical protein
MKFNQFSTLFIYNPIFNLLIHLINIYTKILITLFHLTHMIYLFTLTIHFIS